MSQNIAVLIVDDEESLCELIADLLSDRYQVYKAFNGKQALELVKKHQPTLIISDIMMPHMTGVELLQAIKSQQETKEVPVILLSAVTPSAHDDLKEAAAFVNKPFEIDLLETIVEDTLAKYLQEPKPGRQLAENGQMVTRSVTGNDRTHTYNYERPRSYSAQAAYVNQPEEQLVD